MDPRVLILVAALLGAAWGFVSDRVAARWPAHEDGSIRPIDWRTPLVVLAGAAAFAGTVIRFSAEPTGFVVVGLYMVALVLLFATDLDQRLLPDVITYPLIGLAAIVLVGGLSPFIHTSEDVLWAVGAAILVPAALYLLSIPFGEGSIGLGDLKLLVSVGLLAGSGKLFYAVIAGALLAGVTVAVLLFVRRISLKSFVPYGPFLIAGTMWAILALPQP
jgi:prepilin signal peptidase PulO-like enzyme (type II secretory pathway)